VEREAAGTRKGAGGCARPCARLIYGHARTRAPPRYMAHTYAPGPHEDACVVSGGERHVGGSGRPRVGVGERTRGDGRLRGRFRGRFRGGLRGNVGGV